MYNYMSNRVYRGVLEFENILGEKFYTYTKPYQIKSAAQRANTKAIGWYGRTVWQFKNPRTAMFEDYRFVRQYVEEASDWKET